MYQRLANASDIPAIIQFFKNEWGEDHIFARKPHLLKWQFARRDASFGQTDAPCALTVWDDSNLVGMQGLIPTTFRTPLGTVSGVWLCNLMVAGGYRDKGVGVRLMAGVHRLPVEIIATIGINSALLPIYKKSRYFVIDDVPRLINPISHEGFQSLTKQSFSEGFEFPSLARDLGIFRLDRFDKRWDIFFNSLAGPHYVGTNRTAEYMNWRYVDHPALNYQIIGLSSSGDNLSGVAVYRIEPVRDRSEKVIRVLEIWGNTIADLSDLNAFVITHGKREGVAFADYYCTSTEQLKRMSNIGWRSDSEWQDPIPTLFSPLVFSRREMAVAIYSTDYMQSFINSESEVFFVKSDGDQDRVN